MIRLMNFKSVYKEMKFFNMNFASLTGSVENPFVKRLRFCKFVMIIAALIK
jgi:hypothetical protein